MTTRAFDKCLNSIYELVQVMEDFSEKLTDEEKQYLVLTWEQNAERVAKIYEKSSGYVRQHRLRKEREKNGY